jgi:hypothetical protein
LFNLSWSHGGTVLRNQDCYIVWNSKH